MTPGALGEKSANPQIQTIALTLVLGRCSAATSSAGAGTTDTCHVPSSGSSSAVVLEKEDERNETLLTCWLPKTDEINADNATVLLVGLLRLAVSNLH